MKKLVTVIIFTLSFVSASAFAFMGSDTYVGNPERVDTIWMPGMYDNHGNWQGGHYVRFQYPISKDQLIWVPGAYDSHGYYVEGHWYPKQRMVQTKDCGGCFVIDKQI